MIRSKLIATVNTRGRQSGNFICMETGTSIWLDNVVDFLKSIDVTLTPYTHPTLDNLTNYYLDFPDLDAFNAYVSFCNIMG